MLASDSRLLPSHTIQYIRMPVEHPLNFLMADVTSSFLVITMFLWEGRKGKQGMATGHREPL